ncbi:MAG: cysteine peptidase family C39 domain-containing protein [Isosphaeraceae bacterium]|nr:cysteine peptidase family C39 domain-containing protein [Isosphaeraceae bacterium]
MSIIKSIGTVELTRLLGASVAVMCCLALPARTSSGADVEPSRSSVAAPWRTAERDAANSLYFLLRFHDRAISYDQVMSALGGGNRRSNLVEVHAAAQRLGLRSGLYRCESTSLRRLDRPAIIHLEESGVQSGSFHVLLSTYDPADVEGGVLLLNGGLAIIRYVPLDEFRRAWNGYVLIAKPDAFEGGVGTPQVAALAAAALIGLGLVVSRLRRPSSSAAARPASSPAPVDGGPYAP